MGVRPHTQVEAIAFEQQAFDLVMAIKEAFAWCHYAQRPIIILTQAGHPCLLSYRRQLVSWSIYSLPDDGGLGSAAQLMLDEDQSTTTAETTTSRRS